MPGGGDSLDRHPSVCRALAGLTRVVHCEGMERKILDDLVVMPANRPLVIATRFLLPLDAHIFASRLLQEGIEAQVMDADTIYAVGAFMGSLARGGVRVMVPESQLAAAERILAASNAGEYEIDENFDPNS
jgi:hypothetical protein